MPGKMLLRGRWISRVATKAITFDLRRYSRCSEIVWLVSDKLGQGTGGKVLEASRRIDLSAISQP
jgi:hypothetical protein